MLMSIEKINNDSILGQLLLSYKNLLLMMATRLQPLSVLFYKSNIKIWHNSIGNWNPYNILMIISLFLTVNIAMLSPLNSRLFITISE